MAEMNGMRRAAECNKCFVVIIPEIASGMTVMMAITVERMVIFARLTAAGSSEEMR